jgi:hypothetical protein
MQVVDQYPAAAVRFAVPCRGPRRGSVASQEAKVLRWRQDFEEFWNDT